MLQALSSLAAILLCISACSSTEVVRANSTPAVQANELLPMHHYMDIGIIPMEPGIPDSEEEIKKRMIIPDVRRAEAQYIAFHLKDTLELTGNWGAVRVTPGTSDAVDLTISGKIIISDGELLRVRFRAVDSIGVTWLEKQYEDQASKFSYRGPKEDPFQDLYNDFSNDLLKYRQKLTDQQITNIRRVSNLKFAVSLSPEAFGQYLQSSGKGQVQISQLPADDDRMLQRVDKIKEREYLFVDTLDEYYGQFYRNMKESYDEWRFATYEEALNLRQMKKKSRNRLLGGAALIAGGIYAGSESGTYAGQSASVGSVIGGIGAIKSGLDLRKQAEIHAESLRELSHSLGAEITPYILDIEGRTIELTGTADAQYEQWRTILKEIYIEETGLPETR